MVKALSESLQLSEQLKEAGQSAWLDYISRELLSSGKLEALIRFSGVLGVTSNPSIFQKAISDANGGYAKDVKKMVRRGASTFEIYDALTIRDIRDACSTFRDVYDRTGGEDGYVSLEVRPDLAWDADQTVTEAKRLYRTVGRPNLMIKVPATPEGMEAVRRLIGEGISVNVTLIFSLLQYQKVHDAYMSGLEELRRKGGDLSRVRSVASVFVSRYDNKIDQAIERLEAQETDDDEKLDLRSLKGKAAVANAKRIYRVFREGISSERFRSLSASGAHVQRLLWGSTSTKNPSYPDLIYVETLIGKDTVNTMPLQTLEAFLDHGTVQRDSVLSDPGETDAVVSRLEDWGFDLDEIGGHLQHEGLQAFMDAFDALMKTLELIRGKQSSVKKLSGLRYALPRPEMFFQKAVTRVLPADFLNRLLRRDPTLWKGEEQHCKIISNRLGWITVADDMLGKLYQLDELREEIRSEGIRDIVLLGMGGSSLACEVLSLIASRPARSPRFWVLDTTDPASILAVEKKIRLEKTVFIVSSKSGTTVETMSQFVYFHEKCLRLYRGSAEPGRAAGKHFVAITDGGSRLEHESQEKHFRRLFLNPGDIGGRYSALSFFGLVPAALLGVDVAGLLYSARMLLDAVRAQTDLRQNPGIFPGVFMGLYAREGRDKLTLWTTPSLAPFGAWMEQLIAESTGKEGRGIVPVDREAPGAPEVYGPDRIFIYLKLRGEKSKTVEARLKKVKKAGFPVLEVQWPDRNAIGAEFLRWELATAVASSVLGINPFDEPNVKESKDNTTRLLTEAEKEGKLPVPQSLVPVRSALGFESLFRDVRPGAYVAMLAYIERSGKTTRILEKIQAGMRDSLKLPVLSGFGPRYLHSIGQLYKGGPEKGIFMVFLSKDVRDAKIPHTVFSFSELKRAQALGDVLAFQDRELPLLVVDLGRDVIEGLQLFGRKFEEFRRRSQKGCGSGRCGCR